MGNEAGKWVMYGVDWNDPECIQCGACVDNCSKKAIKYSFKWK